MLWQAAAVAAVLAALLAGPAAVLAVVEATPGASTAMAAGTASGAVSGAASGSRTGLTTGFTAENVTLWPTPVAILVTVVVAARLLFSGDRVGRRLRAARRRHRDLVDLLAVGGSTGATGTDQDDRMRVLEHSTPTAYCVPGLARRVVVTRGTLDSLAADELEAVLAHERAHLTARHDLVLEFFTVMHEAVPGFMRSAQALRSVTLLIEVLADRAAVRAAGVVPTARAIVAMVGGPRPDGALGMSDSGSASVSDARLRIDLLEGGRVLGLPNGLASALMYVASGLLVVAPVALLLTSLPTSAR